MATLPRFFRILLELIAAPAIAMFPCVAQRPPFRRISTAELTPLPLCVLYFLVEFHPHLYVPHMQLHRASRHGHLLSILTADLFIPFQEAVHWSACIDVLRPLLKFSPLPPRCATDPCDVDRPCHRFVRRFPSPVWTWWPEPSVKTPVLQAGDFFFVAIGCPAPELI